EVGEVIVAVGGLRESTFLNAAGVVRVRGHRDLREVAPCTASGEIVELVGLTPAVSGTGGVGRRCFSAGDAIELIVGEGLRAGGVKIVGDAVDVAGVVAAGVEEVVGDVDRVACGGRGGKFVWLQARVIGVLEVEAGEGGRLADGERVEGALW